MSIPITNFAKVTVSTTYDAAATSIVLTGGHGSRLPSAFPFPLVWWDSTTFTDPADDPNKEIVSVTNRVTDTLTVVRAQEGTSATVKNVAGKTYKMVESMTKLMYDALLTRSLSQSFRGLRMQTHTDNDKMLSQVRLLHADSIVMSDGEEVQNWDDIDANIAAAAGIGGLDTGAEAASIWCKIYAMWNGTTKGLMLQRAKDYKLDAAYSTGEDASQALRSAASNNKVEQGFQQGTAGLVEFVDVRLIKTGSPVGNYWFTIEANSGGVPSGTPLATSRKYNAAKVLGASEQIRVIFDTPVSLSAATQYHLVLQADYTVSGANFISWRMDGSAGTYANGSKALFDSGTTTWTIDTDDDMMFKVYTTENDVALVVPAGYRYAHIGWVYNDSGSDFKPFFQNDRTVQCGYSTQWFMVTVGVATNMTDLSASIPPASVSIEVSAIGSVASGAAIGQLSCTDCAGGSGSFRVGQVAVTCSTSVVAFPSISLGPHQAAIFDNNAGSTDYYLSSFYF